MYKHKYLKYKQKYLNLKGGDNGQFIIRLVLRNNDVIDPVEVENRLRNTFEFIEDQPVNQLDIDGIVNAVFKNFINDENVLKFNIQIEEATALFNENIPAIDNSTFHDNKELDGALTVIENRIIEQVGDHGLVIDYQDTIGDNGVGLFVPSYLTGDIHYLYITYDIRRIN